MTLSPGLLEQIAAQLSRLPELAIRRMFGGAGLYSAGVFFGVVDDDRVYLRIGDENRDDFKRAGSIAFQPIPDKPSMAYFSVPTAVIARSERFVEWANKAVAAAKAAKKGKARGAVATPKREPAARKAAPKKPRVAKPAPPKKSPKKSPAKKAPVKTSAAKKAAAKRR